MSKNSFEKSFIDMEKEDEVSPVKEIVESENKSLTQYVKAEVAKIEKQIEADNVQKKFKKATKKTRFSDSYSGTTVSVRRDVMDLINELNEVSALEKYKIIELILLSGLKHINFDD
jgi:replicative superfamily II helicase